MATFELKLPKLGESVTEGTLGKWLKQPGDQVEKYELLVEVQTDKVSTEIPSPVSGTLKEVRVQEGDTVPNGTVLALLEVSEAAAATVAPATAGAPRQDGHRTEAPAAEPQPPAPTLARPEAAPVAPAEGEEEREPGRATPVVRRLAAEHGIDLSALRGSGLNGRVTRRDVEEAIEAQRRGAAPAAAARPAPPAPAPRLASDQLVKLTQMRKAIAENMARSKFTAPHAHAVMEVDMTGVMRFRESVKEEFTRREGFDLSPAAFIVKAACEALRAVPLVNATWTDEGIVMKRDINVGYAIALGDEGLVVPVIKRADERSLAGLTRAIRDAVDRAKARKLTFGDFEGGTFTVNNTGPLGTVVSSPIIFPGQAAIVSSESITKRLVVLADDQLGIRSMMNLVIGFDHRIVDGATAARFLATMRDWLQAVSPAVPLY